MLTDPPDASLARLLAAIGKDTADDAERRKLESHLRLLKDFYRHRLRHITITTTDGREVVDSRRELLQKMLAKHRELRDLREQLGARTRDIRWGAYCCLFAGEINEDEYFAITTAHSVERMIEVEAASIQKLLDHEAVEHKRSPTRRLLIEPFLYFLHQHGVVPSARELPLNRMMDALFDWVGLEPRRRPTAAGLRTIAADMRDWLRQGRASGRRRAAGGAGR